MLIYGTLLIPIFVSLILFLYFKRKVLWWEFLIPFAVSVIFTVTYKVIAEKANTDDTEFIGEAVKHAQYYESWNEYIHRTCTGTRSCGKNCTTTYTYDCSYVQYHPAHWVIIGTNGTKIQVSEDVYLRLVQKFGNKSFVDMHRHYYTDDGDMYMTTWENDDNNLEPMTMSHIYENRTQAASSVFKFQEVKEEDKKKYQLCDYPQVYDFYKQQCVIGYSSISTKNLAEKKIEILNSKLGPKKKLKTFVIIFKNQPRKAGMMQEVYWKGGNKNEFIVAIGVDNENQVTWCHPFSWTEAQILKTETRTFVESQKKLDLSQLSDFLYVNLDKKFIKRDFREFSYLTVEPSNTQLLWAYIVTFIINIGISFWVVKNQFNDSNQSVSRYKY